MELITSTIEGKKKKGRKLKLLVKEQKFVKFKYSKMFNYA